MIAKSRVGRWLHARKDVFSGWLGAVLGHLEGDSSDGNDAIWPGWPPLL